MPVHGLGLAANLQLGPRAGQAGSIRVISQQGGKLEGAMTILIITGLGLNIHMFELEPYVVEWLLLFRYKRILWLYPHWHTHLHTYRPVYFLSYRCAHCLCVLPSPAVAPLQHSQAHSRCQPLSIALARKQQGLAEPLTA